MSALQIALKVDVDTLRGTLEGTPNLYRTAGQAQGARHLPVQRRPGPYRAGHQACASGRAFFSKVQRTSVVEHYGHQDPAVRHSCCPGRTSAARALEVIREAARSGHEVGVSIAGTMCCGRTMWLGEGRRLDTPADEVWRTNDLAEIAGHARRRRTVRRAGRSMTRHSAVPGRSLGYRHASDCQGGHVPLCSGRWQARRSELHPVAHHACPPSMS